MINDNNENKEYNKYRIIIVIMVIIILLMFIYILFFLNNKPDEKINNSTNIEELNNNTTELKEDTEEKEDTKEEKDIEEEEEKQESKDEKDEVTSDDEVIVTDELSYKKGLNIDGKLLAYLGKITISLGDRENPLFSRINRDNHNSFVELAYYNIKKDSLHKLDSSITAFDANSNALTKSDAKGDNIYYEIYGYVKGEDLRKIYKELFGEELYNHHYRSCPMLLYSPKEDRYYACPNCGGTGYGFSKYIYDYKKEGATHIVYIAYDSAYGEGKISDTTNFKKADKYEIEIQENSDNSFQFLYSINTKFK